MTQRGLTLIEMIIAIVLVGAAAGFAIPRIADALGRQDIRSARGAVVTLHATARATAVQRARRTRLVFDGSTLVIRSQEPLTGAVDTVGVPQDLYDRYGTTVTASRDSLVFDPRGLGMESGPTTIVVAKGSYADTVVISAVGRVLR